MSTSEFEKIQAEFIKKAESEGVEIRKNNIRNAKPLNKVCGSIKTKYSIPFRELVCGR